MILQERAQNFSSGKWSNSSPKNLLNIPPERPPKKPHLRGNSPPATPPRGVTPISRPPSRTSSNATPPSRGTTPTSSVRGRPKFPSPPGSPEKSRITPPIGTVPPPPMETNFDYDTPTSIQDMPLPPPPPVLEESTEEQEKPTLR